MSRPGASAEVDPAPSPAVAAAAVAAGVAIGSSLFAGFGFYDLSVWGWVALGVFAMLLAAWIAFPVRPSGPAAAALGGLAGLWLWSLLSTRWAESADQALVDADRWLLYAATLALLLVITRRRGVAPYLLGGAIAPVVATAAYLLGRMATGDGADLFLVNRLNEPLEYANGLGAYMLAALWPMLAVAERARSRILAGVALAAAASLGGLALMTQSRGTVFAFCLSAAIVIALVPGRTARGWALVGVVGAVAACAGPFGDLFSVPTPGSELEGSVVASAARSLLVASAAVGLVWGLARPLVQPRPVEENGSRPAFAPAAIALVALVLVGAVAASMPLDDRIDRVGDQYESFTELGKNHQTDSRLTSGGGNRYDYWRVAWDQFTADPVMGTGAGNYDTTYFAERRSAEDVRNPHSIEMQALGELGIPGIALVGLFAGSVLFSLWSRGRAAGARPEERLVLVAGGGVFATWLGQTSVDWLHLIPGLTGIALCAVAALLGPWVREHRRASPVLEASTGAALVAVAALLVTLPLLAHVYVADGRDRLADDPAGAVDRARDALAVNDESLAAYQLEAAGFARLGNYEAAVAALEEGAAREPSDYVMPALLGDLAARRGELDLARDHYRRASELNPRDRGLALLADDDDAAITERVSPRG